MPSLEALTWTFPTCDLTSQSQAYASKGFGLPAGLRRLNLTILWDHDEEDNLPDVNLSQLTEWGWHEKLTNLRIRSSWTTRNYTNGTGVSDVEIGHAKLPALESLRCECLSLSGILHAPKLKQLRLRVEGDDDIHWGIFQLCCQLEHITLHTGAMLNCLGCSFPDSLVELTLLVGRLQEDGCFSKAPPHLSTLYLSFSIHDVRKSDVIDLRAFTSKGADVKVTAGKLHVSMPPQHNS